MRVTESNADSMNYPSGTLADLRISFTTGTEDLTANVKFLTESGQVVFGQVRSELTVSRENAWIANWYYGGPPRGNLRNRGLPWNRKRVLRIYRSMDLKLRRKRKRRILKRPKQPLIEATMLNETWSMDFVRMPRGAMLLALADV